MARILIVDDEAGIRDFLVDTLVEVGHDVSQAADGAQALLELEDTPFDLVVLDLNMPGELGGLDVLRRARAEWPGMQAIVLTAHGTVGTAVEAMRLGAFDFLEKPIAGPDTLRRLVTRALNWRGSPVARPLERTPEPGVGVGDITVPPPGSGSGIRRFLWEMKRRHVYNVAVTYAAVAFVALQVAQLILPALPLPSWAYTALVVLTFAGFPVAIMLGWIYDVSDSGIRKSRSQDEPPNES